ncbi:MAG: hypothetical protein ABI895_31780 [Deltaproteobacteria bacterium]
MARLARFVAAFPWKHHAPLALALAPAAWLGGLSFSETPLSYDHSAHLFKAWHFWTEMLGRGRLRGWSHFWGFGFPADELVPAGGELWVALFRALSFGQLSWLRTYGVSFGCFLLFMAFAAYWFSRRYFGTAAGMASAWIATADPGATLEGGWNWYAYWGVWPVTLSTSFALMGLVRLEDVLCFNRRRDVVWAGILLGIALLAHQLALLLLAVAVPLLLIDHLFRSPSLRLGHALAAIAALGLAFAVSAYFLVPFMARSGDTMDLGHLGDPLGQVGQRLLQLRTFQNVWAPLQALSLLGAGLALRGRTPGGIFMVASAAAFVVLSSDTLIADLHLERALGSLIKVEANRMLLVAKLFWFPLAAHALVQLARMARRVHARSARWLRALCYLGLPVLGVAVLAPARAALSKVRLDALIRGEDETRYWHDFKALVAWTNEQRSSMGKLYRIAYHSWRGNHLPTLAAVYDQTPIYNLYFTPTQIFDKVPMTDEPELLAALSVKYVVSPSELTRGDLQLERRFGQLSVYRFTAYNPNPFTVLGAGHAELLEFEPERVRLRIQGADGNTRLKLHVASYGRWQATSAGKPVPISTVPVYGAEYPVLMEVPVSDGELVFEYVYRAADWLGLGLTLGALAVLAFLFWSGRKSRGFSHDITLPARWRRLFAGGGATALAALIGTVVLRTQERGSLLPPASIFHRLTGKELRLGEFGCDKVAELSFRCGPHRVLADVISGVWGMHLCMHGPDVGELRVNLKTELGSFLHGKYEPAKEGPGNIEVSVAGQALGSVSTRPSELSQQAVQFDTRAYTGREAELELRLRGAALHCFDFSVVP